jgi:hypothetical protein
MKKQVISTFLNLPGILGLGLMDEYSHAYLSGTGASLTPQQQDALLQGIQAIVGTTPNGFKSFDFCFGQRDASIYKLSNGIVLLVVTNEQAKVLQHQETIDQLKETLENNSDTAVSTLQLLAESSVPEPASGTSDSTETTDQERGAIANPGYQSSATSSATAEYPWSQYIAAMNALTDATAQFLGRIVVANTWRSTRPDSDVLDELQLDRDGRFGLTTASESAADQMISLDAYDVLHEWVEKFIQRCSLTIRDYPERVVQQTLDDSQRAILHIETPH